MRLPFLSDEVSYLLLKTDDIGVKAGLDWHESWWYVLRYCHYFPHKPVFPLMIFLYIFEMIHVILVQNFGIHVYDNLVYI